MTTTTIIPTLRDAGVDAMSRNQWGSPRQRDGDYADRRRTHPMPAGPARYHFLHITVTDDTDTPLEGAAGARRVESYGLSTPPMVSYQDLVTNEGRYFQGQNYGTKGTHTINDKKIGGFPHDLNLYGYAAAVMQNVGDAVSDVQVEVLAKVFAARELLGLVRRGAPIYPHRMFAWKSCPGDLAFARLGEIARLKNSYVRAGRLPGTEPKEWDAMATKAEIRDVVAEVVEAKIAQSLDSQRVAIGEPDQDGRDTVTDDRFARMLLKRLDRLESKLNRLVTAGGDPTQEEGS